MCLLVQFGMKLECSLQRRQAIGCVREILVLVYYPPGEVSPICRLLGYESLDIVWEATDRDSLHLEDPEERSRLFAALLPAPGNYLWTTVERADYKAQSVRLSRRIQVSQSLPRPGEVVRAHLRGVLGTGAVWLDIAGIPHLMAASAICHGDIQLLISRNLWLSGTRPTWQKSR